jgi:hypothetical protein
VSKAVAVVRRLREAQDAADLVAIAPRGSRFTPLVGIVVAVGIRWVVLARLDDGCQWDGFVAVRADDINRVSPLDASDWRRRLLTVCGSRPPRLGRVDPTTTGTVLRSVGALGLVALRCGRRAGSGTELIGRFEGAADKVARLRPLEVRTATWTRPVSIPFAQIAELRWSDRRAEALAWALSSGPRPPDLQGAHSRS